MNINPDFRTVDEVEVTVPETIKNGWSDGESKTGDELLTKERVSAAMLEEERPDVFHTSTPSAFSETLKGHFDAFQESKGRGKGSADWSLLDEFYYADKLDQGWTSKGRLLWKPQIIGSCVLSNTFRPWVTRVMIQAILLEEPIEYLGRNEFGPGNFAFYAPFSYGHARRKANMRRGDGLYCAPATWSLMQGVLPCNTPALTRILSGKGLDNVTDFPEPQGRDGASFYRAMGNWAHLDNLEPYIDFAMAESPTVTSADQLWDLLQDGKPCFVCSDEAIHKVGEHQDGFPVHARNPRDKWYHNMSVLGAFYSADGRDRFFRWGNESWGEKHIYNRRFKEVDKSFRSGRLTMQSIGRIAAPSSSPPSLV